MKMSCDLRTKKLEILEGTAESADCITSARQTSTAAHPVSYFEENPDQHCPFTSQDDNIKQKVEESGNRQNKKNKLQSESDNSYSVKQLTNDKNTKNKPKKCQKPKTKSVKKKEKQPLVPVTPKPCLPKLPVHSVTLPTSITSYPILFVKIKEEQLKFTDIPQEVSQTTIDSSLAYQDGQSIKDALAHSCEKQKKRVDYSFDSKVKCYKCYKCPFITLNRDVLVFHTQGKDKCYDSSRVYHCPGCSNVFLSTTSLKAHLTNDHKMLNKEVRLVIQKLTEANFDCEANQQKPSCAFDSAVNGSLLMNGGNDYSSMALPVEGLAPTEHHDLIPCSNPKRSTMLESYLDEMNNKSPCNMPPPLTQAGSDLLENTFNFTAPVSEQLPAIETPVSSSPVDQSQLMHSENQSFLNMANVFTATRDESQYKTDGHHYEDHLLTTGGYLASDIPVITLEEGSLGGKAASHVTPIPNQLLHQGSHGLDDKSGLQGQTGEPFDFAPYTEEVDCHFPVEEEDLDKKKLKKLGVGFRCDINGCKVRLQSEENIQYHRRCHEGTLYNCPECCKDCPSWVSLSSHLWQLHKIDMELYKCDQCPYKTPSYSRLTNIHRGIHGSARPFLCDVCGKGFKTVKQMRNHKNTHKAKMVRMSACRCSYCGRTVSDKRQLELHIATAHLKKKPYLCSMCGYASAVKHTLTVHMRRHTGEKPHHCDKCDYKTADHNALRRHSMKHTGVRSYKCAHCSYTSIQASTYKAHIKTKHPGLDADIIFSCDHCSFHTLNRGSFLSHMSEHRDFPGARRHVLAEGYTQPRLELGEPIMVESVTETIVDLSGAQSLLEDDYYEVERITGDLEEPILEAQELKFKA